MKTLKQSDRGVEVERLQTLLNNYGFALTVDGIFGNSTESAVIVFQKRNNTTADGIVGEKTWIALEDQRTRPQKEPRSRMFPFLTAKLGGGEFSITSPFGYRINPITGKGEGHNGIDIGTSKQNPAIFSPVNDATVILVRNPASDSAGWYATIKRDNGDEIRFLHMAARSPLKVGQRVDQKTMLGFIGTTGMSTGEHLHLDIKRNGEYIDPFPYLRELGMIKG